MKRLLQSIPALLVSLLLIIPLLAIILPIWLFAFLCKQLNKFIESYGVTKWDEVIQYDSNIGWKPKASLNNVKYNDPMGDIGTITTDRDGWPVQSEIDESQIVVFGDSFAFGFGSKMNKTYYGINNGLRVKPVAAPGYNMVQGLLLMKQYREQIKDKLIIWFICLENDLSENLKPYNSKKYTTPFIRENDKGKNWEIVKDHVQKEKWLFGDDVKNTLNFAHICTKSPYSERVFSSTKFLIEEAKKICDSVNSQLVILTIPDKRQLSNEGVKSFTKYLDAESDFIVDYPDTAIGSICNDLKVSFIAGKPLLSIKDYKPRDPHWNLSGNKKVAEIIHDYYTNEYLNHK